MIRIEIVANHSVEENILEALKKEGVGEHYTKYPLIHGVGKSGPRMGDAIWPEENFALVIWCEHDEALGIERAVKAVKKGYPDEGIKFFGMPDPASPQTVYIAAPEPERQSAVRPEAAAQPKPPPVFGGEIM
ncbi:MAG: hypothetical protein LBT16_07275 [Treponema sp.]|jgi:hypothetical protein|nr:hypothetical protein [Treponema sp.]